MITLLLLLSIVLCAVLVSASCIVNGEVPESLSALVYELPNKWRYVWTGLLIGAILTLMPSLLYVFPDCCDVVVNAFSTSVLLVGVTTLIKREMSRGHIVLGITACFLSQICVAVLCTPLLLMWLPIMCVYLPYLLGYKDMEREDIAFDGKGITVAELLCVGTLYLSVIFNM